MQKGEKADYLLVLMCMLSAVLVVAVTEEISMKQYREHRAQIINQPFLPTLSLSFSHEFCIPDFCSLPASQVHFVKSHAKPTYILQSSLCKREPLYSRLLIMQTTAWRTLIDKKQFIEKKYHIYSLT